MDWKIKKGLTFHHHHVSLAFIFVILLIIIIGILIKPALTGYKLSSQLEDIGLDAAGVLQQIEELKSDVLITETNLKSCQDLNTNYVKDISQEKNTTLSCQEAKRQLQSSFDIFENEWRGNITVLQSEKEQLRTGNTALIANAANNICCKNKVDNAEIDSYITANNQIVCAVGQGMKLTC